MIGLKQIRLSIIIGKEVPHRFLLDLISDLTFHETAPTIIFVAFPYLVAKKWGEKKSILILIVS